MTVIGAVIGQTLKCPANSRGQYPACTCLNGAKYDSNYNWCVNLKD